MKASVGDRIIVRGARVGDLERDGEIVAVEGKEGGPPYLVRWAADGRVSLFFPGPDATVQHFERREPGERR